jgi:hypothetical protein
MNAPSGIPDVERQAQALIDLIERDRARQCGEVLGEANARASSAHRQAREDARQRVRHVFAEQRQRSARELAAARARLATHRRLHEQRRIAALLQIAWDRLPGELRSVWQQRSARAAWTAELLAYARARLQPGAWRIAHAPDWPADERDAVRASLLADARVEPRFEADASIAAGLKVVDGTNVVDGTLAGLLADRAGVEARLLRLLEATA